MARTIFHGPKGVRAIEVRLYFKLQSNCGVWLFFTCTVDSRYREVQWTFWNTSIYPNLDISVFQNSGNINWRTIFHKWICNFTSEVRDILKILWKKGDITPSSSFPQYFVTVVWFSCLNRVQIFTSRIAVIRDKRSRDNESRQYITKTRLLILMYWKFHHQKLKIFR